MTNKGKNYSSAVSLTYDQLHCKIQDVNSNLPPGALALHGEGYTYSNLMDIAASCMRPVMLAASTTKWCEIGVT